MRRLIRRVFYILSHPSRYFRKFYYKLIMGDFNLGSYIEKPLKIDGAKNIYIGSDVVVQCQTWLASVPLTGEHKCKLVIEKGCIIGHFNHIYATHSVIFHKNVLTADKVYISDNLHGYEDIDIPVHQQPIVQNGKVEIGEGSWLGENVCVLGAKIGKHCVIGANSVVTKDIPDYSVAVGAPAKVIKRYDFTTNSWKKIDAEEGTEKTRGGVISAATYVPHKIAFLEYHHSCKIKSPIIITSQFIMLGHNVFIGYHARLEGVSQYNNEEFTPCIKLCDNVSIQQNLHLTCAKQVVIGKNTAIAANVTITDIHHPYDDINRPIEQQDIVVKEVTIGEDCKIYNNAVILPGVHIGKHVTIGANSVVINDIPDYSVAAGIPARVIKKYDFEHKKWIKSNE